MTLAQLLDRLAETADGRDDVSVGAILEAVGRRSFAPLLLLAGLITLAPVIGDIPGVPTTVGIFVALTAGQLVIGREYFWLPRWLLRRSIERAKLRTAVRWLRRPARFVDRLLRPRLAALTNGPGRYAIAVVSFTVGVVMPVMDFVPFSANAAGIVLTALGLSLIAHDGLVALLAFVFLGVTMTLVALHVV